jgi:hypothetical protein
MPMRRVHKRRHPPGKIASRRKADSIHINTANVSPDAGRITGNIFAWAGLQKTRYTIGLRP